jgi:hypothetical protein
MRKLPYGISNFAEIPKRDYFFADKTPFLPKFGQIAFIHFDCRKYENCYF